MPSTLANVLGHVNELQNEANAGIIQEFYEWMRENQTSESYQKNNLKGVTNFVQWLSKRDRTATLLSVDKRETILKYLDTKVKSKEEDPDGRWITTWNDYNSRLKTFYRWLYNYRNVDAKLRLPPEEWKTPEFVQIRKRKSQRISPYSANELWELDETLAIVKYEVNPRNKAAIMLLWDLDARNHEVTNIELRNIRLFEQYAEGEIPKGKTGSGPILLAASFPYVRDWLNLHPLRDYPRAKLICHTDSGKAITADYLWTILNTLKKRIQKLIKEGQIESKDERDLLTRLLREKKWNPYCFRHSAITSDSDYLPGYALNKKVRWTMTSKQPARYIKNRMGDTLKKTILEHNGIVTDASRKPKLTSRQCPKCGTINQIENNFCSKRDCAYPLTIKGYDALKKKEAGRMNNLEKRMENYDKMLEVIADYLPKDKITKMFGPDGVVKFYPLERQEELEKDIEEYQKADEEGLTN